MRESLERDREASFAPIVFDPHSAKAGASAGAEVATLPAAGVDATDEAIAAACFVERAYLIRSTAF